MKKLLRILTRPFQKRAAAEGADTEKLQSDFKNRYLHFRMLLTANNKALEIMANIEQALAGEWPFGMSFVKTSCVAVTVSVLRLIHNLEQLSDGKYKKLSGRFDTINRQINALIHQKKEEIDDARIIIGLNAIDRTMANLVGSKMANLGEISNQVGLQVPDGFVITAHAYRRFIEHNDLQSEIERRYNSANPDSMENLVQMSSEIRERILDAEIPEEIDAGIEDAWQQLEKRCGQPLTVALRSSAFDEDSAEHSFAGQYRSELNIGKESLLSVYKEIIADIYSLTAVTYRLNKGLRDEDIAMSVGCIRMVDAIAGGVMYSQNPLDTGDSAVIINAAWGLPKAVVDGGIDCDLFVVARNGDLKITRREIKEKKNRFVCSSGAGCSLETAGENRDQPSISDGQAISLAELAMRLEAYYGAPQDIEWAIAQDQTVYILQCRPLQQMDAITIDSPGQQDDGSRARPLTEDGIAICPGAASGEVFVVNNAADMFRFPEDAVLVAQQALPLWASLLNRAAAVITEHGTFAGHLANVAREFKVPAIFGVNEITQKLKTGDVVTVDVGRTRIYPGRIELGGQSAAPGRRRIKGSPVYNVMAEAGKLITPLHLLDPYAPDFKAESCKTLHDITRFAHEKSVQEMFNFGARHNFAERSSRQLFHKVPMQWWVLNLDDGLTEENKGKYIKLENIASIPMLALWDGIVAVPWDGPPGLDGKGLASVLFQSTANTALEPGVASAFTERNYFMVSKNYCSFTSRLGYHFSIIEALVSEQTAENYISFQFKGGAADSQRRIRRVHFIADILTEQAFRVDIRGDTLMARIEGYESDFMIQRLKILGYLVIHTRQLDMIMGNDSAISYYRNKFDCDIKTLLPEKTA